MIGACMLLAFGIGTVFNYWFCERPVIHDLKMERVTSRVWAAKHAIRESEVAQLQDELFLANKTCEQLVAELSNGTVAIGYQPFSRN